MARFTTQGWILLALALTSAPAQAEDPTDEERAEYKTNVVGGFSGRVTGGGGETEYEGSSQPVGLPRSSQEAVVSGGVGLKLRLVSKASRFVTQASLDSSIDVGASVAKPGKEKATVQVRAAKGDVDMMGTLRTEGCFLAGGGHIGIEMGGGTGETHRTDGVNVQLGVGPSLGVFCSAGDVLASFLPFRPIGGFRMPVGEDVEFFGGNEATLAVSVPQAQLRAIFGVDQSTTTRDDPGNGPGDRKGKKLYGGLDVLVDVDGKFMAGVDLRVANREMTNSKRADFKATTTEGSVTFNVGTAF